MSDSIQTQPVAAGTLASSVYNRLREDILSGELLPGKKLRTEFLRERYQVGNSPVREALNRLSSDGLVMREDQKGFRVQSVGRTDLLELVKTRCLIEEVALRESIKKGGDDWEEGVVLAYHRLSKVPRSLNETKYSFNAEWERLHRAFHVSLISACGSRWILGYCKQLRDQADRYRQLAVRFVYPKRKELDEHAAIMQAVIKRDSEKATELLCTHYDKTADIIADSDSIAGASD